MFNALQTCASISKLKDIRPSTGLIILIGDDVHTSTDSCVWSSAYAIIMWASCSWPPSLNAALSYQNGSICISYTRWISIKDGIQNSNHQCSQNISSITTAAFKHVLNSRDGGTPSIWHALSLDQQFKNLLYMHVDCAEFLGSSCTCAIQPHSWIFKLCVLVEHALWSWPARPWTCRLIINQTLPARGTMDGRLHMQATSQRTFEAGRSVLEYFTY